MSGVMDVAPDYVPHSAARTPKRASSVRFYTALAVYTGSILLGGAMLARADTIEPRLIEDAALYAAQEYACEWTAPRDLLAAVVADGMPEDIAVEIIADLAWQIIETTPPDALCGSVVAEVM